MFHVVDENVMVLPAKSVNGLPSRWKLPRVIQPAAGASAPCDAVE